MSKTITEFMAEKYKNRKDKDNIYGVGITDSEFRHFIIEYLLGENWYVTDPIGQSQVNEIAIHEILTKYSKRFRKERKKNKDSKENRNKYEKSTMHQMRKIN